MPLPSATEPSGVPVPDLATDPATDSVSDPATGPATDRRAALRARHRRAIVDAAASLMEENGGARFTVDELAARADVARRTIFNHFASLDDVVVEVCEDV
ncbi:helix-turn-helix domain-containing protein, partial [Cellulosimicrobium cellulans]